MKKTLLRTKYPSRKEANKQCKTSFRATYEYNNLIISKLTPYFFGTTPVRKNNCAYKS